MQVRGVPDADRAIAPDGTQKPFAEYSWEQYRKLGEETGSFGKPRRRGLSRSKTATPARRGDPNLEGFAEALAIDTRRRRHEEEERRMSLAQHRRASVSNQDQQLSASAAAASTSTPHAVTDGLSTSAAPSTSLASHQDPTEVILYGFKPSQQYAAIEKFERIGAARICEDYAREAPEENRRYRSLSSYPVGRPLTRVEKVKANNYDGGNCWIKVTFETAEAAHRAVAASPHRINAHWVYAELYHGVGPKEDKEYPVVYSESDPYGQQPPKYPLQQTSQLLSTSVSAPSLSFAESSGRVSKTPGSFESEEYPSSHAPDRSSSLSSSTASSATATGTAPGTTYANEAQILRSRPITSATPTVPSSESSSSEFCTRIPTARRAILRPAEEALLPSRTTSQWLASFLPPGLLTGQMISDVPRTADGTFDYTNASFYWKTWYWIGRFFYFDTLGLDD